MAPYISGIVYDRSRVSHVHMLSEFEKARYRGSSVDTAAYRCPLFAEPSVTGHRWKVTDNDRDSRNGMHD